MKRTKSKVDIEKLNIVILIWSELLVCTENKAALETQSIKVLVNTQSFQQFLNFRIEADFPLCVLGVRLLNVH